MTKRDIEAEIEYYEVRLIQDPEGSNLYNAMLEELNTKLKKIKRANKKREIKRVQRTVKIKVINPKIVKGKAKISVKCNKCQQTRMCGQHLKEMLKTI
jgi:hypothetical protein